MLGKPKYSVGDKVKFLMDDEYITGEVYIVDKWGTFWDDTDVQYDIMVESQKTLYKHIKEAKVESVN